MIRYLNSDSQSPSFMTEQQRWLIRLLSVVVTLCQCSHVHSQPSSSSDSKTTGISDTLNVRVETMQASVVGRLLKLSGYEVVVQNAAGEETKFARSDIFAVTFVKPIFERPTSQAWVFLSTGDSLRLIPKSIDESTVVAQSITYEKLPSFPIPLEFCRAITWAQSTDPIRQSIDRHLLLRRTKDSDLVVLRNGDKIEGEFLQQAKKNVEIETAIGTSQLSVSKIQSLVFNPDLVSEPEPVKDRTVMTTTDGSTWYLKKLVLDKDSLLAESISGFKFSIPISTMVELRMFRQRVVALSSLTPSKVTVEKYLATARQPRMNANVLGGRLMIGRRPFATGIGCLSGTTLEWTVPQNAKTFSTSVGLDRASNGKGSVRFEVLVDGESKWKSARVTGKTALVKVPQIDLVDAKTLTLRTHFDDFGHVLDYANWCHPTILLGKGE
jgi:hypothetical protein